VLLLTACTAFQRGEPRALRPATDRLLTSGDIQVAEEHLKAFDFDPGPVDGLYMAQTQAAVWAYQARYGLLVLGLLDDAIRVKLIPGLDLQGPNQ
jgi:peptidoglycan hydrolase-like protein with peptidoglycan-binding domain